MERTKLLWAAALLLFGTLLISTARRTSLVYDEVIYAPAGAMYWSQGDFRWNPIHPPLQKLISALPLLTQKLTIPNDLDPAKENEWRMGYRVFFESPTDARRLIFLSRLPTIALSLLLACLMFLWAQSQFGTAAAALGSIVFMFDPLVLGNGALAMNDMFVTFFVFAAVLAFEKRRIVLGGVLTGAAIASKLSGLLLIPVLVVMAWKEKKHRDLIKALGIALVVTLACYGFHLAPWLRAFKIEAGMHAPGGANGFLLGRSGIASWYYYPVALFVKTPLPILALWLAGLFVVLRHKAMAQKTAFLLLTPLLFWAAALVSHNHYGLRYLLPATPFLAALVAAAYAQLPLRQEKGIFWVLGLWLIIGTVRTHPYHMAYFNEFAGGSANGSKWLDASNQDWGQDLPALADFLQAQNPRPSVCFGYWGSNRPEAWGIDYQDAYSPSITSGFRADTANDPKAAREFFVVSASLLAHPSTRDVYEWLGTRKPIASLGNTLLVYDISTDLPAVLNLAHIYAMMERGRLVKRQLERAVFLNPKSEQLQSELRRVCAALDQNEIASPGTGKRAAPEKI